MSKLLLVGIISLMSPLRTELLSDSESESDLHVDTCGLRADHGGPDSRPLSESSEELFVFRWLRSDGFSSHPPHNTSNVPESEKLI
jgi:hypothetical protein